ncbi:MAG: hypothetical protein Tsb0034_04680 [Ekhidna sp.]
MKKSIKDRAKDLEERELLLKHKLEESEDELKRKAKSVGKIALISGAAALLGYWVYQTFFTDDEETQEEAEKKRPIKTNQGLFGRLSVLATPYITNFLNEILELDEVREEKSAPEKAD